MYFQQKCKCKINKSATCNSKGPTSSVSVIHRTFNVQANSESVQFRARDTIFGDFCDDNVCACAVSTLILLSVANLSPETNTAIPFPIAREQFSCKLTFMGTLSKLVKKRKLNYVHARKSLSVMSLKEFILVLGKVNLHTKFDTNRREMGAPS